MANTGGNNVIYGYDDEGYGLGQQPGKEHEPARRPKKKGSYSPREVLSHCKQQLEDIRNYFGEDAYNLAEVLTFAFASAPGKDDQIARGLAREVIRRKKKKLFFDMEQGCFTIPRGDDSFPVVVGHPDGEALLNAITRAGYAAHIGIGYGRGAELTSMHNVDSHRLFSDTRSHLPESYPRIRRILERNGYQGPR